MARSSLSRMQNDAPIGTATIDQRDQLHPRKGLIYSGEFLAHVAYERAEISIKGGLLVKVLHVVKS